MKKNHLDFKDLAQSLAMDKGKLERYVAVRFLSQSCQMCNRCPDSVLRMNEIGPNQKTKSLSHVTVQ